MFMGLGSVVHVALALEAEGCGFDPQLDARSLAFEISVFVVSINTYQFPLIGASKTGRKRRDRICSV